MKETIKKLREIKAKAALGGGEGKIAKENMKKANSRHGSA